MADVWIAETGCYEMQHISGVYATAEAAMAAHPIPKAPRVMRGQIAGWRLHDDGTWENGCDWDDAVSITKYEVGGTEDG